MKKFAHWMLIGLALVLIFAVWINYSNRSNSSRYRRIKRAMIAGTAKGDIEIGVVWPDTPSDMFLHGVQLAVDEVNRSGGVPIEDSEDKIRLRKIRIHVAHEDYDHVESPYVAAKSIAALSGVVAVIGHSSSASAIPASIVYEQEGILFAAPVATSPELTGHGFHYVIRTTPGDEDFADALSRSLAKIGAKSAAVLFVRNKYGQTFADFFRESADGNGVKIMFGQSYPENQQDFRSIIAVMRETPFDAVFIADSVPRAAGLIRQLRDMGVTQMILGGDGLDSPELWEVAGTAANNTLVASVFEYNMVTNGGSMASRFIDAFHERYKVHPNLLAAQGYEAMIILAEGFKASRTTVPIAVSTTLRYTGEWDTLFGKSTFTKDGDIIGKKVFIKKVDNGQFVPVY